MRLVNTMKYCLQLVHLHNIVSVSIQNEQIPNAGGFFVGFIGNRAMFYWIKVPVYEALLASTEMANVPVCT